MSSFGNELKPKHECLFGLFGLSSTYPPPACQCALIPESRQHEEAPRSGQLSLLEAPRPRRDRDCNRSDVPSRHRDRERRERNIGNGILPEEDMRRLFTECKIGVEDVNLLSEALVMVTPETLGDAVVVVVRIVSSFFISLHAPHLLVLLIPFYLARCLGWDKADDTPCRNSSRSAQPCRSSSSRRSSGCLPVWRRSSSAPQHCFWITHFQLASTFHLLFSLVRNNHANPLPAPKWAALESRAFDGNCHCAGPAPTTTDGTITEAVDIAGEPTAPGTVPAAPRRRFRSSRMASRDGAGDSFPSDAPTPSGGACMGAGFFTPVTGSSGTVGVGEGVGEGVLHSMMTTGRAEWMHLICWRHG
jgi:hypothetical protein